MICELNRLARVVNGPWEQHEFKKTLFFIVILKQWETFISFTVIIIYKDRNLLSRCGLRILTALIGLTNA
jgi:hypothetical protein